MNEYLFFIWKLNSEQSLPEDRLKENQKATETYNKNLDQQGVLLSANPIENTGKIVSGRKDNWRESDYTESGEVIGGYYHILANDIDEAIEIAKDYPEFAINENLRIEIRPVRMEDSRTDFVYPSETV